MAEIEKAAPAEAAATATQEPKYREGVVHVYDGIEEEDNHLPNWWLGILWGTVIFAFGYWIYYEVTHIGLDQIAQYEAEVAELAAKNPAAAPVTDELLVSLSKDPEAIATGKQMWDQNCVACHLDKGQGSIGPNLTDAYWLHGGKPVQIHKVIASGVVEKGMPAWEKPLGQERVRALAAYVLTLKNTNVPGKPPQGEPEGPPSN